MFMPLINAFLSSAPNYLIALVFSLSAAGLSVVMTMCTRRLIRSDFDEESMKLADKVQVSLVGFAFFVLAIAIGEARGNLTKAIDAANLEAFQIRQLDRHLISYGAHNSLFARQCLVAFSDSVSKDEWPLLSSAKPHGSDETRRKLDAITDAIRAMQVDTKAQELLKPGLESDVDGLQKSRDAVIDKANGQIPGLFWGMIFSLVAFGMVFNVRYNATPLTYTLNAAHMAAIGLAIAFLIMLDAPFRGETSVPVHIITDEITRLSANAGPQASGDIGGFFQFLSVPVRCPTTGWWRTC